MLNIIGVIFFFSLIVLLFALVVYVKERIRSHAWRKEFYPSDTDRHK